jgi:VWFA-related protein
MQGNAIKQVACLLPFYLVAAVLVAQDNTNFPSQSNIVLTPALVQDRSGHPVYGLAAKDFILQDDGVAQAIHLDDDVQPEPVSIIVAIQTGRSAKHELPRIRGLKSMLAPILDEPQTQIAIVEFDSQIELAQDFTSDNARIDQVLEKIRPGDGGAVILDAVNYSVNLLNKRPPGRRILLLVSETRDHGSRWAKIADVVALIGNSNSTIYSLSFSPELSNILDTERGSNQEDMGPSPNPVALLAQAKAAVRTNTPKAIAMQTEGEYRLFESRERFESRMIDFTNHLHSRYLLSFEPIDPHPGLHHISVKLKQPGSATVLARTCYWVADASQSVH